jgi:hypothetical protein
MVLTFTHLWQGEYVSVFTEINLIDYLSNLIAEYWVLELYGNLHII